MNNPEKDNKHTSKGLKPNKLTAILGVIAGVLLVVLVIMILLIPEEVETPIDTVPPTAEPTVTEASEAPETIADESVPLATVEVLVPETVPAEMLENMAEYYEKNSDFAGWIKIGDTVIDYPVMHTPDYPLKYLYMSFEGKYKFRGELFIDYSCTFDPESQVILIHGHNMTDGSMFNNLLNYKSQAYWEKRPTITFSTLYEERTYEIFAAFRDQIYDDSQDVFRYYQFIDPQTEEEFNEGIAYFKEKTTYDMGVDVEYGDKLLMLSTCDRTITNGRFVVVAKLVTEDDQAETPVETQ